VIDYAFLRSFSRLFVGFSGGLDSTVLLHLLAQEAANLPPISAIHIHHGISPNAKAWQQHCESVCKAWRIPFITTAVSFDKSSNLEAAARAARYAVLADNLSEREALLTGHHADDQAETLLLQLVRGAGIGGLSGMKERKPFAAGTLVRPLLHLSRQALEQYARKKGLVFIEDESNLDVSYSRNYMRHTILPLLLEKWPGVIGVLNRTTALAADANSCLDDLAGLDMPHLPTPNQLPLQPLAQLSRERIFNCLRFFIKQQVPQLPSAAIVERIYTEVIQAKADATPEVSFGDYIIRRYDEVLFLEPVTLSTNLPSIPWPDFPATLQAGYGLGIFTGTGKAEKVTIRFRQGGEVIVLHGHTKSLKKLFQQWKVPPWKRDSIPLIFIDDVLAVVVGYATGDNFSGISVRQLTG